jgi:streptogramin lyase
MRSVVVHYRPKSRAFWENLLMATTTASMLVGCAGGSHALPPVAGQNAAIPGNGSTLTQPMESSRRGGVTIYPLPTAGAQPSAVAAGPDGNLWFTETTQFGDKIGKITNAGKFTEYPLPANVGAGGIAAGSDGNLWFTDTSTIGLFPSTPKIGKITIAGKITEYLFPGARIGQGLNGRRIIAGPDGNLWFTAQGGSGMSPYFAIWKVTTAGEFTEVGRTFFQQRAITKITAGPNRAVWFTEYNANAIGKITTGGDITEYPLPRLGSAFQSAGPFGITAGADGNLWFTESVANKIGRMTASGTVTEFLIPTANAVPSDIALGPNCTPWFIESGTKKIGTITLNGKIAEYALGGNVSGPASITPGPGGNLWFTVGQVGVSEPQTGGIGKIAP